MSETTTIPAAPGTLALRLLKGARTVRVTTVIAWRILNAGQSGRPEVYPVEMPYGPIEDRGLPDAIIEPDNRVTHRPRGGTHAERAVELYLSGCSAGLTIPRVAATLSARDLRAGRAVWGEGD